MVIPNVVLFLWNMTPASSLLITGRSRSAEGILSVIAKILISSTQGTFNEEMELVKIDRIRRPCPWLTLACLVNLDGPGLPLNNSTSAACAQSARLSTWIRGLHTYSL